MPVKIASTVVNIPAVSGTQDITISDFGNINPKAAMFIVPRSSTTSASVTDTNAASIAITDGITYLDNVWTDEDNQGTTDVENANYTDGIIRIPGAGTMTAESIATFNSWITNGVRVNWTLVGTSRPIIVVLFGGSDLNASVGSITLANSNSTSVSGLNFSPNVVISTSMPNLTAGQYANNFARFSYGVGCKTLDDNITKQACFSFYSLGGVTDANTGYIIKNNALISQVNGSSELMSGTISSWNTSGFTITTSGDGSSTSLNYLALDVGNYYRDVQTFASEPLTGVSAYNIGFQPQALLIGAEDINSFGTWTGTGSFTLAVATSAGINNASFVSQDVVGTSNTMCVYDKKFTIYNNSNTLEYVSSAFSATNNGWNWNVVSANSNSSIFVLAISNTTKDITTINYFSASPSAVNEGQSSQLCWNISNFTSASIYDDLSNLVYSFPSTSSTIIASGVSMSADYANYKTVYTNSGATITDFSFNHSISAGNGRAVLVVAGEPLSVRRFFYNGNELVKIAEFGGTTKGIIWFLPIETSGTGISTNGGTYVLSSTSVSAENGISVLAFNLSGVKQTFPIVSAGAYNTSVDTLSSSISISQNNSILITHTNLGDVRSTTFHDAQIEIDEVQFADGDGFSIAAAYKKFPTSSSENFSVSFGGIANRAALVGVVFEPYITSSSYAVSMSAGCYTVYPSRTTTYTLSACYNGSGCDSESSLVSFLSQVVNAIKSMFRGISRGIMRGVG